MNKQIKKINGSHSTRLRAAANTVFEHLEKRQLMSTSTITTWSFDNLAVATSPAALSPAPSAGTGTALTVGLQTSSTNVNSPGGTYAYPNAGASGSGDISDIVNGTGNAAPATSDNSSTGQTAPGNAAGVNPAWRLRGSSDGWSSNAAVGSQGAQFSTSTVGYSGIQVKFDLDPSSTSAPSEVGVEYTTDGTTWNTIPSSDLTAGLSSNTNASDGISVAIGAGGNVINGGYYQIANNADALFWQDGETVNLSSIAAVSGDSTFGFRIVNAATGTSEFEVGGTAYPTAGAGNWRLDNVQILATGAAYAAPTVTTNPTSLTVAAGQPATFTAAATGNPTPTVQWYKGTPGSGTAITGANSSSYSFTTSSSAADNGNTFFAVFSNTNGSTTTNVNTSTATLTDTLAAPVITVQPNPASITGGNSVSFTAAATGSPIPTVQWQTSPNSTTWSNVAGGTTTNNATTATSVYSISAVSVGQNGTYFRAVFLNSQSTAGVPSNGALLSVTGVTLAAWNFTAVVAAPDNTPAPTTLLSGQTAAASSLGFTNTYNYSGTTATNSVTNDDITSVTPEFVFRVRGHYVATGTAPNVGTPSGSGNVNGWNTAATQYSQGVEFDVSTAGYQSINASFDWEATSTGVRDLQEEYNLNIGNSAGWTPINSVLVSPSGGGYLTNNQINLASITGASNDANFGIRMVSAYDPSYTGTGSPTYTSATLNSSTGLPQPINNSSGNWGFGNISFTGTQMPVAPGVTTQPTAQTVVAGSPASFTAAASGYPTPTVQWYQSATNSNTGGSAITGANASTYTITATTSAQNGEYFYAVFSNAQGSATTNDVLLTVNSAPVVTTQPTMLNVNAGSTATFTATATGSPAPTVQWQSSTNSLSFTNVTGATSNNFNVSANSTNAGMFYRAVFTNSVGTAYSNSAELDVVGGAFSQWMFTHDVGETIETGSGQSDATEIQLDAGSADAPLPTYSANPYNASTGLGDVAQTLGLFNDYTGTPVQSGADINAVAGRSVINPNYDPESWRIRSQHTIPGFSQLAPELTTIPGADPSGGPLDPQGVLFRVNTTGYTDITLHFQWLGGGIADMQPQYSTDGGQTWNSAGGILQNFSSDYPGITATTTPPGYYVSLQGPQYAAAYNNPNFQLRLVTAYDPNLPLISDGNLYDPAVHGQYATATAGAQNEQQVLDIGGAPTFGNNQLNVSGGTYQLSYGGYTTTAISYSAQPGDVQAALNALPSINGAGGSVSVGQWFITPAFNTSGYANNQLLNITFGGSLGNQNLSSISVVNNTLTGTSPTATIQVLVPGAAAAGVGANGYETGVNRFIDGGGGWEISQFSFSGLGYSAAPTVVTGPASQTIIGGTTATFTATVYSETTITGAQWQSSTGSVFTNIAGATNFNSTNNTSTYTYTSLQNLSDNGIMFRVVFTNTAGSTASVPATLTDVAPVAPLVTLQPIPAAAQVGYVANFTAAATGAPTPTVQWQVNTGSGWSNVVNSVYVSGATTDSLAVTATTAQASQNIQFRAAFINEVATTYSNAVAFTALLAESTITDWNFGANYPTVTTAKTSPDPYVNNPAPTVGSGTASAIGFNLPYDYAGQNDPASGSSTEEGAYNADDIVAVAGAANPNLVETLWRVRGGPTNISGGSPSNGWSNFAKEYTQGVEFDVNTANYSSIYVTMDWYSTTSGELDARQQYTTDGVNWYNLDDQQLAYNGSTNAATGLDDLNPNDPYAPIHANSNDFYGATTTGAATTVTSVSLTSNVATITANNTYQAGQFVTIAGVSNSLFNGVFTVASATSTSFTYALTGSNVAGTAQTGATAALGGYITPLVFNLSGIAGVANNPNFGIRLVNAYDPTLPTISSILIGDGASTTHGQYAVASSYASPTPYPGSAGNWRFDNIVIHGVSTSIPAWLSPASITSGGATYNPSTETLTVTGNAMIIADPAASGDSPTIIVSGSSAVLDIGNTATTNISIGSLSVSGGGTAVMTGSSASTPNILIVAPGTNNFSVDSSSKVDLGVNFLDVQNSTAAAGTATLSSLATLAGEGYNSGAWTGNGLTSNAAASDPTHLTGVGVIENGINSTTGLYGAFTGSLGTFDGVNPGLYDVLVRDTYYGDANLDGKVDGTDYARIDNGFVSGLSGWANGDFNYDGNVNGSDYALIDNAYNTQRSPLTVAAQIAAATAKNAKSTYVPPAFSNAAAQSISELFEKDKKNLLTADRDVVDQLGSN